MTSRERRIHRIYNDFIEKTEGNIAKYYQIPDYNFYFVQIEREIFQFQFNLKIRYNLNLPNDINRYISSFLTKEGIFEVTFPLDYPFKAPIWKLIYGKEYTNLIHIHNHSYEMDWSPSIMIEQDILYLIQHIIEIK